MVRQVKAKTPEQQFGKGKVAPVQIARIVDQYLSDNLFTQTRSCFRSEASSLISRTLTQEGLKGVMSLETIFDEYISMKEQKLVVDMEKRRLEQENFRVQSLLQGMQNVMHAYNASAPVATVPVNVPGLAAAPDSISDKLIQSDITNAPPAGQIVSVSPTAATPRVAINMLRGDASFTVPLDGNTSSRKRLGSNVVSGVPVNAKKSRTRMLHQKSTEGNCQQTNHQQSTLQSSTSGCAANVSPAQGSSIAKVLFHKIMHVSASAAQNSSGPVTPPRAPSGQCDKNVSPVSRSSSINSSNKSTPPDFASNCTIVSTKTIIVSPFKQSTYYSVEKHCSTACSPAKGESRRPTKRDRVKGRLNFDGVGETIYLEKSTADQSSTSESDAGNIFDLDLPKLDFDISDLLLDFDIHCGELDGCAQPASTSLDDVSGVYPYSLEIVASGDQMFPET
uniref:Uncharacterized protein n=1 Tax=Kalanchoe fedtschenkoi TaxID=63787 RepID=A0A7N0UA38_KALFE